MPSMPALIRISSVLLLSLMAGPALAAPSVDRVLDKAQAAQEPSLEPALVGEFALQAGKLPDSAASYLLAAQASEGDAGLAERATRIAMLANDDLRAAQALALWQQRAPRWPCAKASQTWPAVNSGPCWQRPANRAGS
jgi:hypothetical protein